tara:strand:+ start:218 stop:847 length:630 start_codon:yes stop_codon:yes gene_type:complete
MVGRVIDSLIVFRFLKMLVTPFKKTPAYKFGFIDERGNRIKFLTDPDNKNQKLPNNPKSKEEKNSLTPLHRLVFNLKKLIEKIPGGKSILASYAVALLLLKEEHDLDDEQAEQLYEDFYRHLKELNMIDAEVITESMEVGKLCTRRMHGGHYHLRQQLKQNWDENGDFKVYPEKTKIVDVQENSLIYGIKIYEGKIEQDTVYFTAEDVY